MDIQRLKEFVVFAEHLNYSLAAKELFISQPTLSQHISALEQEVGFPLVCRDSAPLRLTEAGELFIGRAQDIINIYDQAICDCFRIDSSIIPLRVQNMHSSIDYSSLFGKATDCLASQSNYRISIKDISFGRVSLEAMLDRRLVDLGFAFSAHGINKEIEQLRAKGFDGFLLVSQPCSLYVPRGSRLAEKRTVSLGDLRGRVFLAYNHPAFASFRRGIADTFNALGIDIAQKLLYEEAFGGEDVPWRENDLMVDMDYHAISSGFRSDSLKTVKKRIQGQELLLDVYAVYDPRSISPKAMRWLDELRRVVSETSER